MSAITEDLELQLTAMFAAQERAMQVSGRDWPEEHDLWPLAGRRQPRRPYLPVAIAAAVVIVLAALVSFVGRAGTGTRPRSLAQPQGAPVSAVRVATPQVSLAAAAVQIEVNGTTFVTASPIEVNSDPSPWQGYTTLELTWMEHGVEMRLSIYFRSDGHQWWSNEIRTYDGRASGNWIVYHGDFFRSPVGMAFVGNFDASAADHGVTGHLRLSDIRLEAFPRPPACLARTAPYALDTGFARIDMRRATSGFGVNAVLFDTATCSPVPSPEAFTFTWSLGNPAIASLQPDGARLGLSPTMVGTTSLRVTAQDTRTGAAVASTEIPLSVSP